MDLRAGHLQGMENLDFSNFEEIAHCDYTIGPSKLMTLCQQPKCMQSKRHALPAMNACNALIYPKITL